MKTRLVIGLLLVLLGAFAAMKCKKWNTPRIDTKIKDMSTKEVSFDMQYQARRFQGTIKLGSINKQMIQGYLFEACSKENELIFIIKNPAGEIIQSQTVTFQ
jgi:hypothetical protein